MCICDMNGVISKTNLENEHFQANKIRLSLVKDDNSYGISIWDKNFVLAIYTIKFCPICGIKLDVRSENDANT